MPGIFPVVQPMATVFFRVLRKHACASVSYVTVSLLIVVANGGCSGCSPSKMAADPSNGIKKAITEPSSERPLAAVAATSRESAVEPPRPEPEAGLEPPSIRPAQPREANGGAVAGRSGGGDEVGGPAAAKPPAAAAVPGGGGAVFPGRQSQPPKLSAAEAAASAGRLLDQAKAAARRGDAAEATDRALEAYEQVLPHAPVDPACRGLAADVERLVEAVAGRPGPAEAVPTRFE